MFVIVLLQNLTFIKSSIAATHTEDLIHTNILVTINTFSLHKKSTLNPGKKKTGLNINRSFLDNLLKTHTFRIATSIFSTWYRYDNKPPFTVHYQSLYPHRILCDLVDLWGYHYMDAVRMFPDQLSVIHCALCFLQTQRTNNTKGFYRTYNLK